MFIPGQKCKVILQPAVSRLDQWCVRATDCPHVFTHYVNKRDGECQAHPVYPLYYWATLNPVRRKRIQFEIVKNCTVPFGLDEYFVFKEVLLDFRHHFFVFWLSKNIVSGRSSVQSSTNTCMSIVCQAGNQVRPTFLTTGLRVDLSVRLIHERISKNVVSIVIASRSTNTVHLNKSFRKKNPTVSDGSLEIKIVCQDLACWTEHLIKSSMSVLVSQL